MRALPAVLAACLALAACSEGRESPEIVLPVMVSSEAQHHFGATLSGDEEVPANASRARGSAIFKLSDDGATLHYRLVVANIEGVTQSHIHIAPAGSNGPVVVFLYGFNAAGTSRSGVLAEGEITASKLIARPAIGFGATMPELVQRMRAGNAYVNVHTLAIPPGEIRGQIDVRGKP
ncbi:MAG TPA: CHRD domain-containing protein [Longimicrobium sp.]|jgi:hypothetical protein